MLFTSTDTLLMVIFGLVGIAFLLQKVKVFQTFGPALTVILLGILLSNLNIVPSSHEIYGVFSQYCVPLSICLYLMNLDLKKMKVLLNRQTILAMVSMLISVSVVAIIGGVIIAPHIPEGWKIAGMFTGTYIGGSPQLNAIAIGLDASSDALAAANAADYVVGMPMLILFFALPGILGKSKTFKKLWPQRFKEEELEGGSPQEALMAKKEWSIKDIAYMLAISFVIVALATMFVNAFVAESARSSIRVIMITTLAIISAQIPAVQKLKGNLDLGLFFSMTFLVTIGFAVNIQNFFGSALTVTLLCFVIIVGSTLLHFVITRLMKVNYEYTLLSIVAGIADGTTSAMVASGAKWEALIQTGLLMGILAGALGNYIGIGVSYAIKLLIGA